MFRKCFEVGVLASALIAVWLWPGHSALAQRPPIHLDESRALPGPPSDLLKFPNGEPITSAEQWTQQRRPQLLKLFTEQYYGKAPPAPEKVKSKVISVKEDALNGKAIRKEIAVTLVESPKPVVMTILLYLPKGAEKAPLFWGLNFQGNHSAVTDSDVQLNTNWMRNRSEGWVVNNRATEKSRGVNASRWPMELIVSRGYGVATAYYGDIDPDFHDGFQNGVHAGFHSPGQKPADDEWGSIAAWAWGLSRGLDILQQEPGVDPEKVAVIGHSRLGKTALWAGASDPRFAMIISNNSGCGGAALNSRQFGETLKLLFYVNPHWFCGNLMKYDGRELEVPVDMHELIALLAPRPVYIASASLDLPADPKGEFLSAKYADPIYRLLGTDGFGGSAPPEEMPAPDQPLNTGTIGYHVSAGKHDITEYDWQQYLDFADRHFRSDKK
ncbi:alpha/beta hydrolase family protein [Planctomicrobium sp. SH527]|uniref:alpha/beta hydrolase family protein n=1 Tax=Planctomicrobium sp. SH527 TaxID=3448123 RepID=UPI003F5B6F0F